MSFAYGPLATALSEALAAVGRGRRSDESLAHSDSGSDEDFEFLQALAGDSGLPAELETLRALVQRVPFCSAVLNLSSSAYPDPAYAQATRNCFPGARSGEGEGAGDRYFKSVNKLDVDSAPEGLGTVAVSMDSGCVLWDYGRSDGRYRFEELCARAEANARGEQTPEKQQQQQQKNPKEEDPGDGDPETQRWACPACTLINEPMADLCAACEGERPGGPRRPRRAGRGSSDDLDSSESGKKNVTLAPSEEERACAVRAREFDGNLLMPQDVAAEEKAPGRGKPLWPIYAADEGILMVLPAADCRGACFLHKPVAEAYASPDNLGPLPLKEGGQMAPTSGTETRDTALGAAAELVRRVCLVEHDKGESRQGRLTMWWLPEDSNRAEFQPGFIEYKFYYPQNILAVPALVNDDDSALKEEGALLPEKVPADDWIIVADGANEKFVTFEASTGIVQGSFKNEFRWPWVLAGDSAQHVVTSSDDAVAIFDMAQQRMKTSLGNAADSEAQSDRNGVAIDPEGLVLRRKNKRSIVIVDPTSHDSAADASEGEKEEEIVLDFGLSIDAFCLDANRGRLIVSLGQCVVLVFELAGTPTKSANKR